MIGINNVTIIGNVGTISEIYTANNNNNKFVNLTVATTETFVTSEKEKKSNTQWHNVVLWNNMTQLHKMLAKGDLIYVEGRLNYRKKQDKEIFTEIVAKNIRILSKKNHQLKDFKGDEIEGVFDLQSEEDL